MTHAMQTYTCSIMMSQYLIDRWKYETEHNVETNKNWLLVYESKNGKYGADVHELAEYKERKQYAGLKQKMVFDSSRFYLLLSRVFAGANVLISVCLPLHTRIRIKLFAGATQYFKLRSTSWRIRMTLYKVSNSILFLLKFVTMGTTPRRLFVFFLIGQLQSFKPGDSKLFPRRATRAEFLKLRGPRLSKFYH